MYIFLLMYIFIDIYIYRCIHTQTHTHINRVNPTYAPNSAAISIYHTQETPIMCSGRPKPHVQRPRRRPRGPRLRRPWSMVVTRG